VSLRRGRSPTWQSQVGTCEFAGAFLCSGVYCEIAAAPAEPRNDKLGGLFPFGGAHWQACNRLPPVSLRRGRSPTWQSQVGTCEFAGAFLCSGVYCEIATAPAEPRNDKSDSLLHPEGRNDKAESLLLALITSRTRQNRNQPLEIATFPNQQTDPPIWDSSSLSAHLSFCGTSSLSASHARLLLSHPVSFQNKLIFGHNIAL